MSHGKKFNTKGKNKFRESPYNRILRLKITSNHIVKDAVLWPAGGRFPSSIFSWDPPPLFLPVWLLWELPWPPRTGEGWGGGGLEPWGKMSQLEFFFFYLTSVKPARRSCAGFLSSGVSACGRKMKAECGEHRLDVGSSCAWNGLLTRPRL